MSETALNSMDGAALRQAMGQFLTGITIVTCRKPSGDIYGMTVNSFNSVSLDPALVLWSLDNDSSHHDDFQNGFAVNILHADQQDLCMQFARSDESKRFENVAYSTGALGHPILTGSLVSFECRPWAVYPGGDHQIYVGEVVKLHNGSDMLSPDALSFFKGKIGQFRQNEAS